MAAPAACFAKSVQWGAPPTSIPSSHVTADIDKQNKKDKTKQNTAFVLFCFVLFCFVLFCFVLFCFVLFRFVSFRFVSFRFVSFCFVLFCFVLFCFVLFCFVLFCFVLFCFVLFCFVLFCFVLFCFFCLNKTKQGCMPACRWAITYASCEGEAGMRRLARVAYEAALAHYMDDSKRRIALHGERRNPPIELSVRTAFKVPAGLAGLSRRGQPGRTTGLLLTYSKEEPERGGKTHMGCVVQSTHITSPMRPPPPPPPMRESCSR